MFQPRSIQTSMTFRDKIMSMDYVLVISILLLGVVSMFAMFSTDGGKFDYHTKSHILRFGVFFLMFLNSGRCLPACLINQIGNPELFFCFKQFSNLLMYIIILI